MTGMKTSWILAALVLATCTPPQAVAVDEKEVDDEGVERLVVKVVAEYPHDRGAFTQGLVWDGDVLLESTGNFGQSTVRRVDPETGNILALHDLHPRLFGEGLALVDGRLIQLTYHAGRSLVYDAESLLPMEEFVYEGEGWGLAWDGRRLVMSNGTSRLTFRDPLSFAPLGTLDVTLDGKPLSNLNELEVVDGRYYANVWQQDFIVRIEPETGKVTATIDASALLSPMERSAVDVLNGIAYDPRTQTFWITGKYWPSLFQVTFEPAG